MLIPFMFFILPLFNVIVPMMVFAIPIIAIICGTIVKLTRLKLENESKKTSDEEISALKKQMLYLEAEQELLQQRIEQLETNQLQQGLPIEDLERIELSKQKLKR